jgi:hypothetical protein
MDPGSRSARSPLPPGTKSDKKQISTTDAVTTAPSDFISFGSDVDIPALQPKIRPRVNLVRDNDIAFLSNYLDEVVAAKEDEDAGNLMETDVLNTPWGEEYVPSPAKSKVQKPTEYDNYFPSLGFEPNSTANRLNPANLSVDHNNISKTNAATLFAQPIYTKDLMPSTFPIQAQGPNYATHLPASLATMFSIHISGKAPQAPTTGSFQSAANQSARVPGATTSPTPLGRSDIQSPNYKATASTAPLTSWVKSIDQPVAPQPALAWSTKKNLFPNAPPAVAPPADLLERMTMKESEEGSDGQKYCKYDPNDPSFRAEVFFIQITGKFKCPHKGCTKSFQARSSFIAHLKSPAHLEEALRLKCPQCLRHYDTATALIQHAESQGVRCKIRKQDQYGAYVDEITASTAATDGLHEDLTVKYVVNDLDSSGKSVATTAERVANANAAFLKKDNEAKDSYWILRKPKW